MGLIAKVKSLLSPVSSRGNFWPWVREPYTGAWQKNDEWCMDDVSAYHAVYACITLIASDIGKLPFKVLQLDDTGIWKEKPYRNLSKLLRNPNGYQNYIQFKSWWETSKLFRGNAYILKVRNASGQIVEMYVLDPDRTQTLVSPDGSVFYSLQADNLTGLENAINVPASEIIHDRYNPLFHPLVGISPLYACGLAANQGLKIQRDSSNFFSNGARPGGVLSAPGAISDETAARLKAYWEANYTGANAGKVAVVGDSLKFESLRMTSSDAQLIEQLDWTANVVCSAFHVPPHKIGVGPIPSNDNVEALNTEYYTRCLQVLIEEMEVGLDDGLELPDSVKIQLDLDALLRMDTATFVRTLSEGIKGSVFTPNEARRKMNLPPIEGGDTVYLQQQNFSLEALNKRDQKEDPFAKGSSSTQNTLPTPDAPQVSEEEAEVQAKFLVAIIEKEMSLAHNN
jgi:HK97 family phage portal protein